MVNSEAPGGIASLRAEHMELTRERLLTAAVDVILEGSAGELSLRDVAQKAGVSAPTAYRHFATKQDLLDAVVAHIDRKMSIPPAIHSVEDFIAALPVIHRAFADNARLMRAYVRTRAATDLRHAGRANRARRVEAAARASFPDLPVEAVRALAPVLQLFSSSSGWEIWSEQWGLEGERAGHVAAWIVGAIRDAVKRDPGAFARAAGVEAPKRKAQGGSRK